MVSLILFIILVLLSCFYLYLLNLLQFPLGEQGFNNSRFYYAKAEIGWKQAWKLKKIIEQDVLGAAQTTLNYISRL